MEGDRVAYRHTDISLNQESCAEVFCAHGKAVESEGLLQTGQIQREAQLEGGLFPYDSTLIRRYPSESRDEPVAELGVSGVEYRSQTIKAVR